MSEYKKNIYQKVNPSLNSLDREKAIIEFWTTNDIFKKSIDIRANGEEFSFYDGPPTANGKPHIGHVLTRVVKDVVPRYKAMKGYKVRRKAGWDTHGLPVELEVEKSLGLDGKQDIEKYGVESFIQKCKESVFKYKTEWEQMSQRVGYWVDMDNPYITYDDKYIESVWWALSEIHKKGLLYKGHKILPYCARCGTSLSSHEVAQGYKDVVDRTAVVLFECVGNREYIAAWTTTPWTLPSNVALCVHPEYEYSLVQCEDGKQIWFAKELLPKFVENPNIIKTVNGNSLVGKQYIALYSDGIKLQKDKLCCTVVSDKFVTLESGTGVVHIAPAYGEDDARVGRENNLEFVQLVGDNGQFGVGQFAGLKFKEADKFILKDLKSRGILFKEIQYSHSYPHCWRCDSALMYYARSSWFVAMSKMRDKLVSNNETINWIPSSIGAGRMGNFLSGVIDWGISRERYWGTPLPVWQCDCGHIIVVSSKAELVKLSGCDDSVELHKPWVDNITIPCQKCGKTMHRALEVIDCWFDSGSMPFAQYNFPHSGKESFDSTFPADFISEAVDQTRGWFYTLNAISTILFDKAPFKNCIVLGHVLDDKGIKMSKHKGNVVDTWSVLDNQGADALRWYFLSVSAPWLPSRFSQDLVSESSRKFIGTLWNVYSFFVLYANIDNFNPIKYKLDLSKLAMMDKWILSRFNSLILVVDSSLNEYKLVEATKALTEFCDDLSNWYIRRCRERFWGSNWDIDKQNAYMTLYFILVDLCKIAAPFVPFVTESIYQNIVVGIDKKAPISVHLCDYPKVDIAVIDNKLQQSMDTVLTIVENGRAARSQYNIKNRQPLQKAFVGGVGLKLSTDLCDIIREELNIKELEFVSNQGDFIQYECKPQLRTLGAKYGKNINAVKQYLLDNSTIVAEFFENYPDGNFVAKLGDINIDLKIGDVLISMKPTAGYASASDKGIVVALDTKLSQQLIDEG
ncbi:MAG: isoleucine--tRNA ligase, partial [Firmicutes bacterium]|nr:isoleucine--tRNA ligase [Bacillota bacterium]